MPEVSSGVVGGVGGTGGVGGGGAGGVYDTGLGTGTAGGNGVANTGGGGGGTGGNNLTGTALKTGGNGGSGIVIVRYAATETEGGRLEASGGTVTRTDRDLIHTFTEDGTFIDFSAMVRF